MTLDLMKPFVPTAMLTQSYNIQFVGASGILLTPKSIYICLSIRPPHLYVDMKKTDSLEKLLSLPREL